MKTIKFITDNAVLLHGNMLTKQKYTKFYNKETKTYEQLPVIYKINGEIYA
jgi:hypothetical protein